MLLGSKAARKQAERQLRLPEGALPTGEAQQPPLVSTRHPGFTFLNRAINPLVGRLLRSPLHWLASRRLALIPYTGRRSGRR